MRQNILFTLLSLTSLILVGCKSDSVVTQPYPNAVPSQSVTPQPIEVTDLPYPVVRTPFADAIRFQFDRPLRPGMTIVTGQGPAGVVISIVNVTLMGEVLGSGVIDNNNRFAIAVTPLPENIRAGIEVVDTGSSKHTYEDFYGEEYKGEGALVFPQVGYFQDTVMVKP